MVPTPSLPTLVMKKYSLLFVSTIFFALLLLLGTAFLPSITPIAFAQDTGTGADTGTGDTTNGDTGTGSTTRPCPGLRGLDNALCRIEINLQKRGLDIPDCTTDMRYRGLQNAYCRIQKIKERRGGGETGTGASLVEKKALKEELREKRRAMREKLRSMRAALRGKSPAERKALRQELREEIMTMRQTLREELRALKGKLRGAVKMRVRTKGKGEEAELKVRVQRKTRVKGRVWRYENRYRRSR